MSAPKDAVIFMPAHSPSNATGNLYIMRAVPGCGKTHRASRLASQVRGVILSADHFYGEGEEYRKNWSREKAHLGHRDCEGKCLKAMQAKTESIIIDNTNISLQGFRYYLDEAVDRNYNVYFVYPDSPWWTDSVLPFLKQKTGDPKAIADTLFQKNTHGVPKETILDMMNRFQWVTYDDYLTSVEAKLEAAKKEVGELEKKLGRIRDMYL